MTELTAERMEEFLALAERVAFGLRDGRTIEGYVLDRFEDALEFGHGGPMAPDAPERILYADIDPAALSYLCKIDRVYKTWVIGAGAA